MPRPRALNPSPDAIRMRRAYERQRAGSLLAIVELPYSLTASLIACGLLSDEDSFDARKRGEALLTFALKAKRAAA